MKRRLLILLALLLAGQLNAQMKFEGRFKGREQKSFKARDKRPSKGNMQEMLEKYDEDNDGFLDMKERMKARKEQMKKFQPDKNKPGFSKQEKQPVDNNYSKLAQKLKSLKKKNPQKYNQILEKFDQNGNRKMDKEEIGQILHEQKIQQSLIKNFDKNKNGKIDQDEMAILEAEHQKRISEFVQQQPELFASILDQFDKNSNQKLDFGEWVVAHREGVFPSLPPQHQGQFPPGQQMGGPGMGEPPQPFAGNPPANFPGGPGFPPPGNANMPKPQPPQPPMQPPMQPGQPFPPQPPQESGDDGGLLDGVELTTEDENDQEIDFLDF